MMEDELMRSDDVKEYVKNEEERRKKGKGGSLLLYRK